MVATKGKGWRLSPLIERAFVEADAVAPGRSKRSDGTIGDAAHQSRESFHNPWEGWVDAGDLTHDPANGFDVHSLFRWWVATDDPILDALDHLISDREIASAARGWVWRKYSGSNGHTLHGHMAGKRNSAARNYAGPIFIQEDDMQPDERQALFDVRYLLVTPYSEAITEIRGNVQNIANAVDGAEPVEVKVDESKVAEIILRTLTPEAIAEALGDEQARAVADEIGRRLTEA